MKDFLEELRQGLNASDAFCRNNGIHVDRLEKGYAEASMELTGRLLNGLGAAQGGAIFTLADLAAAAAANSYGNHAVSQSATISFLRPGLGKKLTAQAVEVHRGRTTGLYEVAIRNDEGKLVAKVGVTVFILETRFESGSAQ